jgi:hypothetical protein
VSGTVHLVLRMSRRSIERSAAGDCIEKIQNKKKGMRHVSDRTRRNVHVVPAPLVKTQLSFTTNVTPEQFQILELHLVPGALCRDILLLFQL